MKGNSCCSRPDFGTRLNALLPAIDEDEVVKKKKNGKLGWRKWISRKSSRATTLIAFSPSTLSQTVKASFFGNLICLPFATRESIIMIWVNELDWVDNNHLHMEIYIADLP